MGTQTLSGNGTVVFGNAGYTGNALYLAQEDTTLTLGPGITVRGENGTLGSPANTSWPGSFRNVWVINQGTLSAEMTDGHLVIAGQAFRNQGVVGAANGGHLSVEDVGELGQVSALVGSTLSLGGTYTNHSVLNLTDGAVLNLDGQWCNRGLIQATNSTVNLVSSQSASNSS